MIIDLFAGASGWAQHGIGYDHDRDAVATSHAAGYDVRPYDLTGPVICDGSVIEGIVGSPPCQGYSRAGKHLGRTDERSHLVRTLSAWATVHHPLWVAAEQVRDAGPAFRREAAVLVALGYKVWCGLLHAEQYGVPQTRTRIILMAHLRTRPTPPIPTHSRYYPATPTRLDPGVLPWVSMAAALNWDAEDIIGFPRRADDKGPALDIGGVGYRARDLVSASRPAQTVTHKSRSWVRMGDVKTSHGAIRTLDQPSPTLTASMDNGNFQWVFERPSPTIVAEFQPQVVAKPNYRTTGPRQDEPGSVVVTPAEAGVLQSFPADYPWHGSKTSKHRLVGNAIPPLLANAVVERLRSL